MSTTHTSHPPARLGANHGYSIDGDVARIHADVEVLNHALLAGDWTLQLWACDSPHMGGPLSGVIVAEAAVTGNVSAAEPHQQLVAEADARVPGGLRDYAMVLALVSGQNGHDQQVHDFANYPARQRFITPHLEGGVGYEIDGDQVLLTADAVRNPRDFDNLSGSLSLELWALQRPYAGGRVEGQRLGGLDLGRLPGQGVVTNIATRVAYSAPAAGRWEIVLMLREWAGAAGFITRDYASFAIPYQVDAPVAATAVETPAPPQRQGAAFVRAEAAESSTVASAPVAHAAAAAASVKAAAAQAPAASATTAAVTPVKAATVAPAPPPSAAPAKAASAAPAKAPSVAPATAPPAPAVARAATTPAASAKTGVSVNHASLEELAAVKGLSKAIAREIVKGRPYQSLAALVDVRGIGPKLLLRIREDLSL